MRNVTYRVCFCADDNYITGGSEEGPRDPFGCATYRKIIYDTFPLSKARRNRQNPDVQPHEVIRHLTVHQVAYVDLKVSCVELGLSA